MKRKSVTFILLALASIYLSGCLFSGDQSEILTNDQGRIVQGRNQYDAYADGKIADSEALQKIAEAAEKPSSKVTVTFDDNNKPIFMAECNTASTVLAAKIDTILPQLNASQVPKNAVAQVIEATGGAAKDILTTPASVGGVVAVAAVEIAKNGTGNIQNGDIIGSQNGTKVIGDGTATAPAITGDTVFEPEPLLED